MIKKPNEKKSNEKKTNEPKKKKILKYEREMIKEYEEKYKDFQPNFTILFN